MHPFPSSFRVGIAGGGIGGLALAQGLRRSGIDCAVFERDRHRTDRLEGYRIHVNPAGSRSLHALLPAAGWQEFLATTGKPGGGFTFLDQQLRTLVAVEEEVMYPNLDDPVQGHYPVDRTVLRQLLLRGIEDQVHFAKTVTGYEELDDGRVAVLFTDRSAEYCDLLIGADGAESAVRAHLLPQAVRVDAGAVAVGLRLPLDESTKAWLPSTFHSGMNLVLAAQRSFLFTAAFERRTGSQLDGYVFDARQSYRDYVLCAFVAEKQVAPDNLIEYTPQELQDFVSGAIRQWHPLVRKLIQRTDPDSAAAFPLKYSTPVGPWPTSRVTVLGDALHSMPPVGGLGANAALRDARLLHDALCEARDGRRELSQALALCETRMRSQGFAAVETALKTQRQGLMHHPLAVAGSQAWFRLAGRSQRVRRLTFGTAWNDIAKAQAWESDTSITESR